MQTPADDDHSDGAPLQRNVSSDSSTMRLVLGCSSEDDTVTPPPTHVSDTSPELDEESVVVESQESVVVESQDSVVVESQDFVVESGGSQQSTAAVSGSNSEPETPRPAAAASSTTPTSSSSQAHEVVDSGSPTNVEHDEFLNQYLDNAGKRVLVRPYTSKPRLWQSGVSPHPALCRLDSVDDAVRLAATGVVWCLKSTMKHYEVVLNASLGWQDTGPTGNRRSHQIRTKGPIYCFLRSPEHMGTQVTFQQLTRVHVHHLFKRFEPCANVNLTNIDTEKKFVDRFLTRSDTDGKAWRQVRQNRCNPNPKTLTT